MADGVRQNWEIGLTEAELEEIAAQEVEALEKRLEAEAIMDEIVRRNGAGG